jgi:hypothetical protein
VPRTTVVVPVYALRPLSERVVRAFTVSDVGASPASAIVASMFGLRTE